MEQLGKPAGKIGIYKITFPNQHYYIGQSLHCDRRKQQHSRDAKKNKHTNSRFQNCFNKYGEFIFEILEECERNDLDKIESKYIQNHIEDELCCNFCREGRSKKGVKASDETRQKISNYQYLSGKNKPVYMFSRDNFDMLARFDSIKQAELSIGAYPKDVQKSCKSNGKYNVKSYKFLYAYQIDNMLNHIKSIVNF